MIRPPTDECPHPAEAIAWNEANQAVQCHRCGEAFAPISELRELVSIQGQHGTWDQSRYMLGMFNGMECLLACAENREPEYRDLRRPGLLDFLKRRPRLHAIEVSL